MFRHLTSRLTATLAAAALTLGTVLPNPAGAMDDKDRRLLTMLLGAAAVGVIINEANKNKKKVPIVVDRYDDDSFGYSDDRDWRRDKHRWRHRTIPAECVFSLRGARGPRDVVSGRCLSELGLRRDLPAECAFEIDAGWGSRTVYGTRCLRENGYRIAEAY
ncbi:MAG: hypothetical protein ACK4NE_01365 [Albidovulum sp.]